MYHRDALTLRFYDLLNGIIWDLYAHIMRKTSENIYRYIYK